jgi:hypothetical protein
VKVSVLSGSLLLVGLPLLGCLLAWTLVLDPYFFFFYSPKYGSILLLLLLQFTTIKIDMGQGGVYYGRRKYWHMCYGLCLFSEQGATSPTEGKKQ